MVLTLVSIIIPVFNGANYMREAIDSALAQTWPATEIIVVNDGSTDNGATAEIARSYKDQIRYIEKPNGGVASALNAGIAAMKGEVFCWLSHDDRHWPEKTERQMAEWVRRQRADIVLISDFRVINERGEKIMDVVLNHAELIAKPQYTVLRGAIHGCSVFVPKKAFDLTGPFDEAYPTTQDYDLWHRMQRLGVKFIHIPDILIDSRSHDEQGSKKIDHLREVAEYWLRVVDDIPVEEKIALEGSDAKFLSAMATFLERTNLMDVAEKMHAKALAVTPLVSVVIPVYNQLHLLPGAIQSALSQTHRAIEIIVVDDGSTESPDFLDFLVERYAPRVRLMRRQNGGPAAARNTGWQAARGEYVAFLDADDVFLPQKIDLQLANMIANNSSFSHTGYYLHRKGGGLLSHNSGAHDKFPATIGHCSIATPTVMLRTGLREQFQFPDGARIGEGNILWVNIAARHGTLGIDECLTVVRESAAPSGCGKENLRLATLETATA